MMTTVQEIFSIIELTEMLERSWQRPVLFFKHSSTCGISTRAFAEYEKYLALPESEAVTHCLIVVQTARPVSSALADAVGVEHESPQAILVRDGRAIWNDSHMALKCQSFQTVMQMQGII